MSVMARKLSVLRCQVEERVQYLIFQGMISYFSPMILTAF